ncbi:LysR family transcriptional regulator [Sciscionella sediminilitoris]|uniref:LysR family transcriptional regulator n=1 Tax=Sciscionella sediminilitoris TaxID=1445613 RepID=UPI0004DFA26D|nr:LysR family transcriptional regulator [Sciscionella sp. SE31]
MEIFHLRYFLAVAEELSFSRAARRLHMATSPLSQRVRDLERELEVVLFDRDSHHVGLTRAGEALLPIARDVLGRFDDIGWRLREEIVPDQRTVYIGVPPGLHRRVRERLKELESRATGYRLKRWPGGSADLAAALQRGELGLALVHLPVHIEGIGILEVDSEPLGAVLPAAEFRDRESVSLSELTEYTYVRPAAGMSPTYFEQLGVRIAAAGINKKITLSSGDYGSVSEFVANGSAFAISMLDPESDMHKHRTENNVVLPFNDFQPALTTGLAWRENRDDLRELLELAQEVLSGNE